MAPSDHDKILEIVDEVIGDLRLRDRMFTARRPDPGRPEVIVIQTEEDGRHVLPIPSLEQPRTLETFIAAAQAHLSTSTASPFLAVRGTTTRSSPESNSAGSTGSVLTGPGGARSETTRRTPGLHYSLRVIAAALSTRLTRRGVRGVRRIGCIHQGGQWVAQVGIWPD
jgi:hypothetical protein